MGSNLTQTKRFLKISTALGPDKLFVQSFSGGEEVSRLFSFHLDLVSEDFNIQAKDLVGTNVTISILHSDDSTERYFNGFIARFVQLPSQTRLARYQAEVVPWLWFLTCTSNCRIFQNKTVPEIVQQVFSDLGFSDYDISGIQGQHNTWDYCVQYRETAFNFVSRLLEQEGISYYFKHGSGKHTLMLGDRNSAFKPCPFQAKARAAAAAQGVGQEEEEDTITHWEHRFELRSGKWAQTDYNFEKPSTSLLVNSQSVISVDGNQKYEIYDYPGEYLTKSDGEALTKIRMEEEEVPYSVVAGAGGCRSFTPGGRFTLTDHERESENAEYILTSVRQSATQSGFFSEDETLETNYTNSFTCIPVSVTYRPTRITPRPLVHGSQTAVVVGPAGEEIYPDNYGRVKVQFHWDRQGKKNENSSCWIRVSQPWAGKNWGAVAIPRIGQEVVVDFLEGDPDRPIIIGRVYNAEQMPPYELPANQTQSGMKSRSSKGGTGSNFNEIRFEDKKSSEELYIHAEKDENIVVENDKSENVGHDEMVTIGNNRTETVVANETLSVGDNRTRSVGKNEIVTVTLTRTHSVGVNEMINVGAAQEITVGAMRALTVGISQTENIGKDLSTSVGKQLTVDAGDQILLKTGKASLLMKKDGTIVIQGKDIAIKGSGNINVKASKNIVMRGKKIAEN